MQTMSGYTFTSEELFEYFDKLLSDKTIALQTVACNPNAVGPQIIKAAAEVAAIQYVKSAVILYVEKKHAEVSQ